MTEYPKPQPIADAPGLVYRERRNGWVAVWQCRTDIFKAGFSPSAVPLWRGAEPSELDRQNIASQCQMLQAEMMRWHYDNRGRPDPSIKFDGTVQSLIDCYKTDEHSPFRKLRYRSRENYGHFLKRIGSDYGHALIADLKGRDMRIWYDAWAATGHIPMAHSLMRAWRTVLSFGLSILDNNDCAVLATKLRAIRFPMGKPRESILTADQANLIRARAHALGFHSLALAQAIQFEGMLRQKDVIGEWVPKTEPGPALAEYGDLKWQRGVVWNEIDSNLVLRHVTSKRQKLIEIRLGDAPMVVEEFARFEKLPTFGPVIVFEPTGRPYSAVHFRELWRKIADDCGIPKTVRNQDSRAGAITEATEAGAPMESIKQAATHSNISMTERYSRNPADKTAVVHRMRAAHRNKSGTPST